MPALDFPASPTPGQTYTANGNTWQWDATTGVWLAVNGLSTALAATGGAALVGVTGGGTAQQIFDKIFQDDLTLATFTTAAQALNWTVGDAVFVPIWGGSRWTVRSEVILQNHFSGQPLQSSKVDFDDQLHVQVPLVGGGTGVLECDLGSIQGFITGEVTRLYNEQFNKLERKAVLGSVMQVWCYGDSITYGQTAPALSGGSVIPTGFGDGSNHEWTQISGAWPATMLSLLDQVFGSGKCSVTNRGYSGDRVGSAYKRHRFATSGGATVSIIAYGTNDTLFGSNNGINPERLFDTVNYPEFLYSKFTNALRKFAYREVLRGSLPVLAAPFVWKSLTGYDGTTWAAGKIGAAFRMAVKSVADEIGAGFIDWSQIINERDNATMTLDGVHLSAAGHLTLAARTAPLFVGKGWRCRTDIYGRTKLMNIPHLENMNGPGAGATDLTFIDNGSSLGKGFNTAANGADTFAATDKRFFAFYSHVDEISVIPVGYMSNGVSLTFALNFGDTQGALRLNTQRGAALGVKINPSSSSSYTNSTGSNVIINHMGSSRIAPITVKGRGWHLIQIEGASGAFVQSGWLFDYFDAGAAITNASAAHALNSTFTDTEVEAALDALGGKINAILTVLRDQSDILS